MNFIKKKRGCIKRIFTSFLAVCMLVSILPVQAIETQTNTEVKDFIYDFRKANVENYSYEYPATINYAMTTSGDSGEVNPSIQSDPWAYFGTTTTGGNSYFKYNKSVNAKALVLTSKASGSLKIKLSKAGKYIPKARIYRGSENPVKVEVFRFDAENNVVGDKICGKGITASTTETLDYDLNDIPVEFAAGEYIVTLSQDVNGWSSMDAFKLINAASKPNVGLNIDSAGGLIKVRAEESIDIPLAISMSDKSAVDYSKISIQVAFDKENIASAIGMKDANSSKVSFTGISEGKTTATITVSDGNSEASAKINMITISKDAPAEVVDDFVYNFKKAYVENVSYEYPPTICYAMTTNGAFGEVNPTIQSDPWAYFGTTATGGNSYFKYMGGNYALALSYIGSGSLKVKVPVTGNYMPAATIYKGTDSPITIEVCRYDAINNVKGEKIVAKNLSNTSKTETLDYNLTDAPIEFTAGEYIVTISQNTAPKGWVVMDAFKLINLDKKLKIQVPDVSVIKEKSKSTAITVTDYQGNAVNTSDLQYTVQVSDPTIATASVTQADDKLKLDVQGLKIGQCKATINFSSSDGKTGQVTVPITVRADFDLNIDLGIPDKIKKGEVLNIPASIKYVQNGTEGQDAPAEITVKSSSKDILNASVTEGTNKINNTIQLTPVSTGCAALDVTIKVEEVVKTFKYSILVYDTNKSTKNYQYMIQNSVPGSTKISDVSNYFKTIPGSGEQIRPGAITDTWCYAGQSEGSNFKYMYDSYGSTLEMGAGAWGAIKIRVPESGIYQAVSQNALYPMAGIMHVYLAPADAENPRDPKYALGTKDTFIKGNSSTIVPAYLTKLRTVDIDAGDYIVTWEIAGGNPDCTATSPRLYIGGFMLNAVTELPKITLNTELKPSIKKFTTVEVPITAMVSDDSAEDFYGAEFTATPKTEGIVSTKMITRNNKTYLSVTGVGVGDTVIHVALKIRGVERATLDLPIKGLDAGKLTKVTVGVQGSPTNTISIHQTNTEKNQAQLEVHIFDEYNEEIPEDSAKQQGITYSFESMNTNLVTVNDSGLVYAFSPGKVIVRATASMSGVTQTGEVEINVTLGKSKASLYTTEKIASARENADLYPWAKAIKDDAVKRAEKFIDKEEMLWNSVTTQELPRSYYTGYRADPEATICRYCGCDIRAKYGSAYGWIYDAYKEPWKIQCPDCRRKFPSNDFGKFYELGIDESGNWRYELAKERNAKLVAEGKEGYLVNKLYPEKDEHVDPKTGQIVNQGVHNWGADDGYGYDTGKKYPNGCKEMHTYISFYNHWAVWHGGIVKQAIDACNEAYMYTGDVRYGRVGAILLDRIADVYPDMDTAPYVNQLTTGGYKPHGKVSDLIWENELAIAWTRAYDAIYPMYDDSQVVNFLADKAKKYKLKNDKSTSSLIRTNCEDGILREIFRSAQIGNLEGNFGMTQSAVTLAAVVLDSMPETREMIDWVFQDGIKVPSSDSSQACKVTGGNVNRQLITDVDRDGVSNEISPGYSQGWTTGVVRLADALDGYEGYPDKDLYKNPRLLKMFSYLGRQIMSRKSTVQIGDSGATADTSKHLGSYKMIPAFKSTANPMYAQILYFENGNKTDGLHYDIFTKNPNSLEQEVQEVINKYGEYDFDKSEQLCGYGLSVLRSGSLYPSSGIGDNVDTQRTFWMCYTRGAGHGHKDALNLGIEAMGLNIAPEFGYPKDTTSDDYGNWGQTTVTHNTVLVNNTAQNKPPQTGKPIHFDDSGRVKLMDADHASVYPGYCSIYRRSVITVQVDNKNSYGIDFFRVKGGNEHLYSFHALSDTIEESEGLNLVAQKNGTYAGENVEYGTRGYNNGYSYLKNVNRAANVSGGSFMVDFKIKDFRKKLKNPQDMHLRMTMLNGFDMSEVAVADGCPPPRDGNPESLKFVLAKRSGNNLDTLFTTVFEPYSNQRYIEKIEPVSNVKHADGSAVASGEVVRAVKVTLVDGRIDYVVYAADNSIEYRVDDLFNIRGFVGVYTLKDGQEIYSYVNDGDKIGDTVGVGAYTGTVVDFTKDLNIKNSITVQMDCSVDTNKLVGQYIYIKNVGKSNAVYEIKNATMGTNNQVVLDIDDVTLIDDMAYDGSYIYNIEAGQTFRIPLPVVNDTSPIFNPVSRQNAEAGREFKLSVHATSPADRPITYRASSLPRGANVDTNGQLTWIPDSHQVGPHHIAITASDGKLESTINFVIQVYHGTNDPSQPNPPIIVEPDKDKDKDKDKEQDKEQEQTKLPHFDDLAGYDWAKDSIVKLAEEGIIKGTSETTFHPGSDITRADFAILVVRALKLDANTDANFKDVSQSDYFADELAVAKACGIITGTGDNQFNPRGKITREDMMTIMARALEKAGYKLEKSSEDPLKSFADQENISDYALDAAATLVQNGIITGSNGKLNPKANTTRAEVAVLLNRVLNEQSK